MEANPMNAVKFIEWSSSQAFADGSPSQWDTSALKGLYDISASPGKVVAHLKVTPYHANYLGNLHGGVIASLADTITSAALSTYMTGGHVSLSLNVDYLNAGLPQSVVRIEAEVIKPGKTVSTMVAKFFDNKTNRLLAQASHVKYVTGTIELTEKKSSM